MKTHSFFSIVVLMALSTGGLLAADLDAGQKPKTPPPKPFHNIRFEEDWSRPGGGPAYKRIQLGDQVLLGVGGQIRMRAELWDNFGFSNGKGRDDGFGLSRVRLHTDLYVGPHFRLFAEGMSSLATTRDLPGGQRTLEVDSIELHNAIADLRFSASNDTKITFRLGRQEMQYGKQRLVSPLDWANTRPRTFDAARAIVEAGGWRVDGFWGRQVRVRKYAVNPNTPANTFFGTYVSGKFKDSSPVFDFYWLGLKRPDSQDEQRHTMGGRISGKVTSGLDYDAEAAYQVGDWKSGDVRAWMFASQFGWSFYSLSPTPRVFLGFDYASGDRDPTDNRIGTFDQLFPLGHAFLGSIDVVGRQNIVDLSSGVEAPVLRRTTARFETHFFWRAREEDALYNAGGGVVRGGFPGSPLRVGEELGLTLNHSLLQGTVLSWGVYHFIAADFIEETGPADHTTFGFVSLQYTF